MAKKNICVLFGGESSEHDISLISAATIMKNADRKKYEILPVGITRSGEWFYSPDALDKDLTGDAWTGFSRNLPAVLSSNKGAPGLIVFGKSTIILTVDCIIPAIHGENCEDGVMQGLLALTGIPYVGCDCVSSAICMDKSVTKLIVQTLGIRQASFFTATCETELDELCKNVRETFGYPAFVKPAATGSSVGISKARNDAELTAAVKSALRYGRRVLIEEFVDAYEIETAVIGNESARASCCGQVLPAGEFYSFDSKYINSDSKTLIPADIPLETSEKIRAMALKIYHALGCEGLARVDFFVRKTDGEIVFNEINTLPGFTGISMYPKLFEHEGIIISALIDELIDCAAARQGS